MHETVLISLTTTTRIVAVFLKRLTKNISAQRNRPQLQFEVHKPGKRDKKIRKAVNWIREISQQNQYNKQ